ncbi:TIR domain-containing protein [Actinokineospora soli]|uniref:TIR domain-containing protein n=1 Tax=Actinokineospora soli TaxID=1048753 RepID=A0ABW2TWK7_9PSEU
MPQFADARPPAVFVSFAGPDRPFAVRLRDDLRGEGVRAFVDECELVPGANVVLTLSRELDRSDYYVLLWSAAAVDRPYVDAEWTAAFAKEIAEQRAFLFVLRLDATPLPALLAARKYLDAAEDWDGAVAKLAATWRRDLDQRVPVVPQPRPTPPGITLYIRNRALGVAHTVTTPPDTTGQDLHDLVRRALALPTEESRFGGRVGLRFGYRLLADDEPVPDKPLSDVEIGDGDTLDLEITVEPFSPDGPRPSWDLRSERAPNDKLLIAMARAAFRHLAP